MLEKLDSVPWATLDYPYIGSAIGVPGLLRALTSFDEEVRAEAIHELYGTIWHQDTICEATAYAVPFLIELLEYKQVPDKDEILALLATLVEGQSDQVEYEIRTHEAVAG